VTLAERNLLKRALSAVVALPLLAGLIFWREPLGFGVFCLVITALALNEYGNLTLREALPRERTLLIVLGTAFAAALYFRPGLAPAWVMATIVGLGVATVALAADPKAAVARLTPTAFGVFYIGGLLTALPLLQRDLPHGPLWVALTIAVTFANDTGAYFVGRALGKHKLAPAISPGKTIEGAIGGLAGSLGMMLLARATFFPALTLGDTLAIGAASGVLGPSGDLLESLLKRAVGAKDSGRLIPGHGGVLDRIDALLFVGAYVFVHARFLR
jgi:phosphatidate cytidylyltransferase